MSLENNKVPSVVEIRGTELYRNAIESVARVQDLKSGIVDVCKFVFNKQLTVVQLQSLIDSDLESDLLSTYFDNLRDASVGIVAYLHYLQEIKGDIEANPEAVDLIKFLREEIEDFNNEFSDFNLDQDFESQYPELRLFREISELYGKLFTTNLIILNKEFLQSIQVAEAHFVQRFSSLRRDRLRKQLRDFEQTRLEERATSIVSNMFVEDDWSLYPTRFEIAWQAGESRGMTRETFMASDLASDIKNIIIGYLSKGYDCTPTINVVNETLVRRSIVSYNKFYIRFTISNELETREVDGVDYSGYYNPIVDGYTDDHQLKFPPLHRWTQEDLQAREDLLSVPEWNGDLRNMPNIDRNFYENYNGDIREVIRKLRTSVTFPLALGQTLSRNFEDINSYFGLVGRSNRGSFYKRGEFESQFRQVMDYARAKEDQELLNYALNIKSVFDKQYLFDDISSDFNIESFKSKIRDYVSQFDSSSSGNNLLDSQDGTGGDPEDSDDDGLDDDSEDSDDDGSDDDSEDLPPPDLDHLKRFRKKFGPMGIPPRRRPR